LEKKKTYPATAKQLSKVREYPATEKVKSPIPVIKAPSTIKKTEANSSLGMIFPNCL